MTFPDPPSKTPTAPNPHMHRQNAANRQYDAAHTSTQANVTGWHILCSRHVPLVLQEGCPALSFALDYPASKISNQAEALGQEEDIQRISRQLPKNPPQRKQLSVPCTAGRGGGPKGFICAQHNAPFLRFSIHAMFVSQAQTAAATPVLCGS